MCHQNNRDGEQETEILIKWFVTRLNIPETNEYKLYIQKLFAIITKCLNELSLVSRTESLPSICNVCDIVMFHVCVTNAEDMTEPGSQGGAGSGSGDSGELHRCVVCHKYRDTHNKVSFILIFKRRL